MTLERGKAILGIVVGTEGFVEAVQVKLAVCLIFLALGTSIPLVAQFRHSKVYKGIITNTVTRMCRGPNLIMNEARIQIERLTPKEMIVKHLLVTGIGDLHDLLHDQGS
jgi:hypothetical protein